MPKFHARVHPILARNANTAVIIRRGPSKSVCTMLWDRGNDTFMLGQWLRGRIYERRCDLSPDGKHFIYFAMNGKWSGPMKGSWTAISRSPYLKALALWPWGDCWNGGGLFLADSRFWRNAGYLADEPDTVGRLRRKLVEEPGYPFEENYGGECPGVYYLRLQRDGWKLVRIESGQEARMGINPKEGRAEDHRRVCRVWDSVSAQSHLVVKESLLDFCF